MWFIQMNCGKRYRTGHVFYDRTLVWVHFQQKPIASYRKALLELSSWSQAWIKLKPAVRSFESCSHRFSSEFSMLGDNMGELIKHFIYALWYLCRFYYYYFWWKWTIRSIMSIFLELETLQNSILPCLNLLPGIFEMTSSISKYNYKKYSLFVTNFETSLQTFLQFHSAAGFLPLW